MLNIYLINYCIQLSHYNSSQKGTEILLHFLITQHFNTKFLEFLLHEQTRLAFLSGLNYSPNFFVFVNNNLRAVTGDWTNTRIVVKNFPELKPGDPVPVEVQGKPMVWGNRPEVMPGPATTFQSYGPEWAHLSNTPFRLYKHWVHEGGISSPFIARWPKQLKERGGWTKQSGHMIDIMATCLDAAGVSYPKTYQGQAITPMEGKSLLPAMRQPKKPVDRNIYWEHEGNRAVLEGHWKLVAKHKGPWELYNLDEDRIEMKDLAASEPARAKRMEAQYQAWASRAQVVPWDELKRPPTA